MKKNEKGAVTIEATISLTIYLFAFMMIFSLVNLCRVQMKMSVAVNNVAKEISQYSYLYGLSGLNDSMANAGDKAQQEQDSYAEIGKNVSDLYGSIVNLGKNKGAGIENFNPDNIKNLQGEVSGIRSQAASLEGKLKAKLDNPKEMLMGICTIFVTNAAEDVKTLLAEYLAKALVKQNLKTTKKDGDAEINRYLQKLGIKKTKDTYFDSIDFGYSELFPYGKNEIKIVAVYEVKAVPLLDIDSSFTIVQTARTRGWLKGNQDKKDAAPEEPAAPQASPTQQ